MPGVRRPGFGIRGPGDEQKQDRMLIIWETPEGVKKRKCNQEERERLGEQQKKMLKCRDIRISYLESTKASGTDLRFDGPQPWVADAERSSATGSRVLSKIL